MKVAVALIILYKRFISSLRPPCCRFIPTCSTYAIIAIKKWGLWKGGFLAFRRFLRCSPINPGGYDPVE